MTAQRTVFDFSDLPPPPCTQCRHYDDTECSHPAGEMADAWFERQHGPCGQTGKHFEPSRGVPTPGEIALQFGAMSARMRDLAIRTAGDIERRKYDDSIQKALANLHKVNVYSGRLRRLDAPTAADIERTREPTHATTPSLAWQWIWFAVSLVAITAFILALWLTAPREAAARPHPADTVCAPTTPPRACVPVPASTRP